MVLTNDRLRSFLTAQQAALLADADFIQWWFAAAAADEAIAAIETRRATRRVLRRRRPNEAAPYGVHDLEAVLGVDVDEDDEAARINDYLYGEDIVDWYYAFPERLYNATRLSYDCFIKLAVWLDERGAVKPGIGISIEQKLLIFFKTCAHATVFQELADQFHHSKSTISTVFHEVLDSLDLLHRLVVCMPTVDDLADGSYRKGRLADPTQHHKFGYFNNVVGAIDGIHLKISVRAGPQSIVWLNRKGFYSQNVLAAVDLNGRFLYVLGGMEGRAHDGQVYQKAFEIDGFRAPDRYCFVADGGYSLRRFNDLLTPYDGVRYHLAECEV